MPKLSYNAPVVLTFSLIAFLVLLIDSQSVLPGITSNYFTVGNSFDYSTPKDYWLMVAHVFGHADWNHLFGNFTFILLLGPILEEKYGSRRLFFMILITAVVTGVINVLFMSTGLLGASGVVFMFIVLSSITDLKQKTVPMTFLLVVIIFLGKELADIFNNDNISHLAHLIGGGVGTIFGFVLMRK